MPPSSARRESALEDAAARVLDLARTQAVAASPFLADAAGRLLPESAALDRPLATDGRRLLVDAGRLVAAFREQGTPPSHDLLHCALHCLLLHPFAADGRPDACWDLACDIVAERLAAQVLGPRAGERGRMQAQALAVVSTACGPAATAERIARRLRAGAWRTQAPGWENLFAADDHAPWRDAGVSDAADAQGQQGQVDGDPAAGDSSAAQASGASVGREVDFDDALQEEWRKVARRLVVALESLPREAGERAGMLVQEVEAATRPKVDYASWLRQFAAMGEELRLSDEDFDPVFYTFGLRRYGNLPLVEPLETREERRVREFVVVIDTSQSVSGDAVRRFVDETAAILKSTETFARKVHLRILQCDAQVQAEDVITDTVQLEEWGRHLELRGFGGTDFRPAFRHVDALVAAGAFEDLGGLVYFTDGWGTYPEWRPPYKVAFAFYDSDHRPDDVPPWAVQVELDATWG